MMWFPIEKIEEETCYEDEEETGSSSNPSKSPDIESIFRGRDFFRGRDVGGDIERTRRRDWWWEEEGCGCGWVV